MTHFYHVVFWGARSLSDRQTKKKKKKRGQIRQLLLFFERYCSLFSYKQSLALLLCIYYCTILPLFPKVLLCSVKYQISWRQKNKNLLHQHWLFQNYFPWGKGMRKISHRRLCFVEWIIQVEDWFWELRRIKGAPQEKVEGRYEGSGNGKIFAGERLEIYRGAIESFADLC